MAETRTYRDRKRYLIEVVKKRRKKVRQMAIMHKGGKCQICGYDRCPDALEFHHLNSNEKDFGISNKGYTRSWKCIKNEIEKCLLLCANCHREIHSKMQLPRGIVVEKPGEFREAYSPKKREYGNPEPSLDQKQKIKEGAETRAYARTPDIIWGKRPAPHP
jgi:5-methylcytosine-specific restriction endonuclease McrA